MSFCSSRYFGPPGAGTLNQGGLRPRCGWVASVCRTLRTSRMPPGFERPRVACWRSAMAIRRLALRLLHRVGAWRDRHATAFEGPSPSMPHRPHHATAGGGRENGKYGRFRDHPAMAKAIVALGLEQHAVLRLDDLRGFGLTDAAVHKRAATGRLHRCYQSVYS